MLKSTMAQPFLSRVRLAWVRCKRSAPVLIYTRLAGVRAYGPLLSTASLEQLHALRIEFKKLRYALDSSARFWR